jgi:hypothetical protein
VTRSGDAVRCRCRRSSVVVRATSLGVIPRLLGLDDLDPAPRHVGKVQRRPAFVGGVLTVELGVAEGLARQDVDVDEAPEAAEEVEQHVRRQRARRAHDEQTRLVPALVGGFRDDRLLGVDSTIRVTMLKTNITN